MKETKFYLITDTHYFKNSLGAYGPKYEEFMDGEQKCFGETEAINKAVLKYLETADEADILLIAGDLSFNGEKESHKDFSALLADLKEKSGKKIYVVTAGHDFNDTPFAYDGGDRITPEGTRFDELLGFYGKFGYEDAIAFNEEHLSYVAQLSDDVRLLVICNDTAEGKNIEYTDEFLGWMAEQAQKAKADGMMMIAMEHYPVLPGQPLLGLIGDAWEKRSKELIATLADNDVHLIFTGHMHNQSINEAVTDKGNKFYDVCTGSTIGCPAFIRLVTIEDESTVRIESIPVPDFEWNAKGDMSGEEYLKRQFERMIRFLIDAMANNPPRFLRKVSIKDSAATRKIFSIIGKKLNKATIGGFARLLWIKADPSIKKESFVDFAVDIVRTMFEGNQPFVEGTPKGDVLVKAFKKIAFFKKTLKDSQGNEIDTFETLKNSVGNYGTDDYNATLILK